MAFTKNVENITVDGYAVSYIKKSGGSLDDIGFATKVEAEAVPIQRDTTLGSPTVGYDLIQRSTMTQTLNDDFDAAIDAIDCAQWDIIGNRTKVSMANVYLKVGLKAVYSNKSESEIVIEAMKPGQTKTQAKAWFSNAS